MRILIVAKKENKAIDSLGRLMADINPFVEIVGPVQDAPDDLDSLIEGKSLDLILINRSILASRPHPTSLYPPCDAAIVFKIASDEFTFVSCRTTNKKNGADLADQHAVLRKTLRDAGLFNLIDGQLQLPAISNLDSSSTLNYRKRFLVRTGQKYISVDTDQVSYFFSEDRFIFLKTKDKNKFLVEYRIEELEKMLDPTMFFKVNRSFIISINAIEQAHSFHGNRLKLVLNPDEEVIVSRERVRKFKIWMGE